MSDINVKCLERPGREAPDSPEGAGNARRHPAQGAHAEKVQLRILTAQDPVSLTFCQPELSPTAVPPHWHGHLADGRPPGSYGHGVGDRQAW